MKKQKWIHQTVKSFKFFVFKLAISLCCLMFILIPKVAAQPIMSPRAIYERCYAKLTRTTPESTDPFIPTLTDVASARAACKNLLSLAQFGANNQIGDFSGQPAKRLIAKRILQTMNDFHFSWFNRKNIESAGTKPCSTKTTSSAIDTQEPAYFFSQAFFDPQSKIDSAVTSTHIPKAIRSVQSPNRSVFYPELTRIRGLPNTFPFTPNGELLGIETQTGTSFSTNVIASAKETPTSGRPSRSGAVTVRNYGGGILGSSTYLLLNWDDTDLVPNLERMPRHFGKYIFEDLLCRQLPVVKASDVGQWVAPASAPASTLPFRRRAECVACHASMDQASGVVRNFRQYVSGDECNQETTSFTSYVMFKENASLPAQAAWGTSKDVAPDGTSLYHLRPANGRFVFRTYDNTLVNQEITSTAQLGNIIANLDDYYICAAKRYYQFFTGIDVKLAPMTTAEVSQLHPDERFYRNQVVNLGKKLRSMTAAGFQGKPARLVEAIFDTPEFTSVDIKLQSHSQSP